MAKKAENNIIGKFHFDTNIPDEVLPVLKNILLPLEWILPGWLQHCFIHFDPDGHDGRNIDADLRYEYRYLHLNFYPAWLTIPEPFRVESTIHDLLHSMTCVLYLYALEEIEKLIPDNEQHRESVTSELVRRHESLTQDLTFMIMNKVNK